MQRDTFFGLIHTNDLLLAAFCKVFLSFKKKKGILVVDWTFFSIPSAAQPTCRREGGRVWLGFSLCWGDEQQRAQHAGTDPPGCSGHPHPPLPWKPSSSHPQQGQCVSGSEVLFTLRWTDLMCFTVYLYIFLFFECLLTHYEGSFCGST